ncbi:response regulator [Roseiconus lacunae]|uniref:response regulator n=1 Tax=Roseiconus lacunae TaxID=2605694 RepID=UPI00135B19C0|nr:response regulator [Roseiconus lacunae]
MTPKTILFADDDPDLLRILVAKCKAISPNIEVVYARNAMAALTTTNVLRPDMVCMDVNMPRGNGMAVCEMIATHADLQSIPLIVLTGQQDEAIKERCRKISAHYIAKSGSIWPQIESIIRDNLDLTSGEPVAESEDAPIVEEEEFSVEDFLDALELKADADADFGDQTQPTLDQQPSVLIIDDDPAWGDVLRRRLEGKGIQVRHALEGLQGFREAVQSDVQAIILDYEMHDVHGDYVLGRLKDNPLTKEIPVIVVTGHVNNALKRKVLNIGAAGFLNKPCTWDQLWGELQRRTLVCA